MKQHTQFFDPNSEHLDLLLAVGEIGVWELNVRTGEARRNLRHDQIFGYQELLPEWTYPMFLDQVAPSDRAWVDRTYSAALEKGDPWSFECRIRRANDGEERWISAVGRPLKDEQGEINCFIGHVIDITKSKRNEERLEMLTAELNHRVRNMLGMLQGIMRVTAKSTPDVAKLEEAFQERLSALARTHNLFVNRNGDTISIAELVHTTIPAGRIGPGRLRLTGDTDLTVTPKVAESLTLILTELLLNALRFGALSNQEGRVEIELHGCKQAGARAVWRETGGPAVDPPQRQGFGTTLFNSLLGEHGGVTVEFPPTGVICEIRLDEVSSTERTLKSEVLSTPNREELRDMRIMIVEDEIMIGLSLELSLTDEDAIVLGPYSTADRALDRLDEAPPPDAAVLDVQLGKTSSQPVAERLREMGVPFLFTTGQADIDTLSAEFPDTPVLEKPVREDDVIAALRGLVASGRKLDA